MQTGTIDTSDIGIFLFYSNGYLFFRASRSSADPQRGGVSVEELDPGQGQSLCQQNINSQNINTLIELQYQQEILKIHGRLGRINGRKA